MILFSGAEGGFGVDLADINFSSEEFKQAGERHLVCVLVIIK